MSWQHRYAVVLIVVSIILMFAFMVMMAEPVDVSPPAPPTFSAPAQMGR